MRLYLFIGFILFSISGLNAQTSKEFVQYGLDRLKEKDVETAMTYFKQAIQLDSLNSTAYTKIGMLYAAKRNVAEAAPYLDKAVRIDDNPEAHFVRASLFAILNDFESALIDLSYAYDSLKNQAGFYELRASINYLSKNIDSALSDYSKLIELNPNHAMAYYFRGGIYVDKGNLELACKDYRKAKELKYYAADKAIMENCKKNGL